MKTLVNVVDKVNRFILNTKEGTGVLLGGRSNRKTKRGRIALWLRFNEVEDLISLLSNLKVRELAKKRRAF